MRQKNPSSLTKARRKGVELRHGHPFAFSQFLIIYGLILNSYFGNFTHEGKKEVNMQRIVIHVKDDTKINALVSFLNEINFIDIESEEKKVATVSRKGDLRKLFGIWKNRNTTLADIRQKAWR